MLFVLLQEITKAADKIVMYNPQKKARMASLLEMEIMARCAANVSLYFRVYSSRTYFQCSISCRYQQGLFPVQLKLSIPAGPISSTT